jgi:hypothetical protein
MTQWDGQPIPERQWAIKDRVPLNQAGLFSREGGTGKSIIELTKNVAHVCGKDWLGSLPEPGPAFYLGAEDDEREIHIRLAAIAKHYGVTFKELIEHGLHVLCLLGQDATLCAMRRSGKVEITSLYRQVFEAAGDIKPKNISIDTLSRAFAGNEIDRVQVYAFANHMQARRRRLRHRPEPPQSCRDSIRLWHFRQHSMARRLSLSAISERRQSRGRRTARRRFARTTVQEKPIWTHGLVDRPALSTRPVSARARAIEYRKGS